MTPEDVATILTDVHHLRRRFAAAAPRSWTAATAAAELTVQLGHLALCMLRRRGADLTGMTDPGRPITNIGDELADVLLAALSVATLASAQPAPPPPPVRGGDVEEELLRLAVWAGQLAEAAMIHDGLRHQPLGTVPTIPDASTAAVAACDTMASQLGLNLLAEFRAMVSDADASLSQAGIS